ncbi:MAG: hypothetical protein GXP27_16620 [Planctomycetes bacterium]|nr:hypothetical protein [Planctomycetota bacterium]
MIPEFDDVGNLPPGIHWCSWAEFVARFGSTARRRVLIAGLLNALSLLRKAGCRAVYVGGSFVTAKASPGDFDVCWDVDGVDVDRLDPIFFEFSRSRAAQKRRFGGELFPAELPEGITGQTFLEFFQTDRSTGRRKGIVAIRLEDLPE